MTDPLHFTKLIIGDLAIQIAHLQAQLAIKQKDKDMPNWKQAAAQRAEDTARDAEQSLRETEWEKLKAAHEAGTSTLSSEEWAEVQAQPGFAEWVSAQ